MISSMTGFGEATEEVEGIVYTVEIRTVNNRFKPHVCCPISPLILRPTSRWFTARRSIARGALPRA